MTFREYLRNSALLVESPYLQSNLRALKRIANSDATPKLINGYSVKDDKIFCHICGGHRHQRGITAEMSDGTLILFGKNCAEKFFGPKIWERCWGEFKRKQEVAFARYRISNLRNLCGPMKDWLARNRQQVLYIKGVWDQIILSHPKFAEELEESLKRNNNRIIERTEIIASQDAAEYGLNQNFFQTKIITTIRGGDFIYYISDLDKSIIIIEAFLSAVEQMPDTASDHVIIEYSKRLEQNVRTSARKIDGALEFAADLFSEQKLSLVGAWSDRARIGALRNVAEVTPRDIAKSIRNICGYGYQKPRRRLEDTIPNLRKSVFELSAEKPSKRGLV